VLAKISSDVAELPSQERWTRIRAMERTWLADRFKASLHREIKDFPVYELVVARKEPKIRELGPLPATTSSLRLGRVTYQPRKCPWRKFVDILNHRVDRPVINLTGNNGVFGITLDGLPNRRTETPLRAALQKENGDEPNSSIEALDGTPR
jgi:uncharacterized protein (TIGR03435 family)